MCGKINDSKGKSEYNFAESRKTLIFAVAFGVIAVKEE